MLKKDFLKQINCHRYTGGDRRNTTNAIFFDHAVVRDENGEEDELFGKPIIGRGYKYCVYARAVIATKKELINTLYDFLEGRIDETPWYIQLVIAQNDAQRFKVPLCGNYLTRLIDYSKTPIERKPIASILN